MASGRHRERPGGRPTATQSSVGKGIRTRIRSASCVANSHRMLRQMHASSTGRERGRYITWGLGKSLVSGSRLCPPPFTSTRHVTRERGLGGVAPKSGAPRLCCPRRASTCRCPFFLVAPVQFQLPVFPCASACLCSHFWSDTSYVDDALSSLSSTRHSTWDPHAPSHAGLTPEKPCTLTRPPGHTRTLIVSLIAPDGLPHRP